MKITELFPELPAVMLNSKEYELKFATRAILQLEIEYPDQAIEGGIITSQERILNALNSGFTRMKTADLVNLLHAGLAHTKAFNKETLIDAMQPYDFPLYINHIITAYQLSKSTPEQLEKMEVMAQANKSKKKMEKGTTVPNTPTTVLNVD